MATYTGLTPEQIAYAEEHHPGVDIGMAPGYNPAAPGTWAEHIALLEAGGYPTEGLVEPGTTPTTPIPTTAENIAAAPTLVTPTAPALGAVPTVTPAPAFGAPTVPEIPKVTEAPEIKGTIVTPAPAYEKSAEQLAWEELHGGTIRDVLEKRGEGIPQETQDLMIRQTALALQTREAESIRLMQDDMERRGITNSGLLFSETTKIKATTTRELAASITDVQIKSALMKMESFERAMGHSANFLGYLANESVKAFAPKMATWNAQMQSDFFKYQSEITASLDKWKMENQFNLAGWQANKDALFAQWKQNADAITSKWQMENLAALEGWKTQAQYNLSLHQINAQAALSQWQGQMDIYKLGIAQAYEQDNMTMAADIAAEEATQQHLWDIEIAEMEMEMAQDAAQAEAAGSISGTIVTGLFSIL